MTLNQDASYDQYIKGLMDISQAITSDLYLEDILKLIVMVTARATGFAICSLWLLDKNGTSPKIRLKATRNKAMNFLSNFRFRPGCQVKMSFTAALSEISLNASSMRKSVMP